MSAVAIKAVVSSSLDLIRDVDFARDVEFIPADEWNCNAKLPCGAEVILDSELARGT